MAPLRSAQGQFGGALQIVVDGQAQVLAGLGVLNAQVAHLATVAVHNHIPRPVLPAQQLVISLFDARLAHHVAGLVIREARIVQIVLAHLAHVADQVSGKAVARIKPPLLVDRVQLRQLVAMGLNKRLLVGGNVLLDGNRLVARRGAVTAQCGAQLLQIQMQSLRNQRQIGIHVVVLLADQEARNGWVVVHHQPVLAVEELAARRQHRFLANAVLLGQQR